MQVATGVIMVLAGIVIVAFAARKVGKAAAHEPTNDKRRHPVIATFLAAPGLLGKSPGAGRNTATAGWLLGGALLVAIGLAYLLV